MQYEPEVIVKKKGGFLGKLVALILGIIIGIIAGLGGVAGGVYYIVAKMQIKKGFELVNGYLPTDIDYTQYINGSYGEKTVYELVGDAAAAISEVRAGTGTLNDLNEISPYIETLIKGDPAVKDSGVVYLLSTYGIKVDGDEMMKRIIIKPDGEMESYPDKYLLDYITDAIYSMEAGELIHSLSGTEVTGIMKTILYGANENDTPLTVEDLISADLDDRINSLPLDSIMDIDTNDSIISSLAYGADHRYTKNADGTVTMKQLYYILETAEDGSFVPYDDMDVEFDGECTPLTEDGVYKLVFANDDETQTTQYLKTDPSTPAHYLVYEDAECTKPIDFQKTTVGSLNDANDLINCIALKDALNITGTSEKFLISLAYGVEGVDYDLVGEGDNRTIVPKPGGAEPRTIRDLREKGGDLINEVYLSDIVTASPDDKVVMYMLYGKEGLHYVINETTKEVDMLQEQVAVRKTQNGDGTYTYAVYNEYGDVLIANTKVTEENEILYYTVNDTKYVLKPNDGETVSIHKDLLPENADYDSADLYYVFKEDGVTEVEFDHTHLGDLKGKNPPIFSKLKDRLTISDVLGADSGLENNKILKHLQNETIAELPDAVANLTVGQVFEDDIYKTTEVTEGEGDNAVTTSYFIDANGNPLVYNETDGKYYIKGTATEGHRVLKGSWKYLLTDENGNERLDYKIAGETKDGESDGMSAMMDNMTRNIQKATLETLVEDEIIDLSDEQKNKLANNEMIAKMTISRLIEYALDAATTLNP